MFGLYGDLPAAKAESDVKPTGWGTTATSLKPAPRKVTTNLLPPPSVVRRNQTPAQAGTGARPQAVGDAPAVAQHSAPAEPGVVVVGAAGSLSASVDEYDPARPNNYEDVRISPSSICCISSVMHRCIEKIANFHDGHSSGDSPSSLSLIIPHLSLLLSLGR